MGCDIKQYIKTCATCQRGKFSNEHAKPASFEPELTRFETVHDDLVGPVFKIFLAVIDHVTC